MNYAMNISSSLKTVISFTRKTTVKYGLEVHEIFVASPYNIYSIFFKSFIDLLKVYFNIFDSLLNLIIAGRSVPKSLYCHSG